MKTSQEDESLIEVLLRCASECQKCATYCLKEDDLGMMTKCIQLNLECSAICYATAQVLSLGSEYAMAMCKVCADVCEACARECDRHESDHCQKCAVECKACEEECRKLEFTDQT